MADIDEHAATELDLYISNDSFMYNRLESFLNSIRTKIRQGKYDPSKAPKLWLYYVDEGAKRYMKEIAGSGKVSDVFNKPTREALAKEYAKDYYQKIMRLYYDRGE